jgi:hypothetical protein
MVVWKYPFTVADHVVTEMPMDAVVIDVREQDGQPCFWVLCDPRRPMVGRQFRVFGTGHPIPSGFVHVGTFHSPPFVWHVFEDC